MWLLVRNFVVRYVPFVMLPFAGIVGTIGYHIEELVSDKYTPAPAPIGQQRAERLLQNVDTEVNIEAHNPLKINLSPSLSEKS
ncbi:small integral membrane protein 12 [Aphidius gifuensis]|uniref:small integral membrane protein 12 n=1 Tax=Aphidius gifuensis TaxID=684658 RepID=UPI001CDC80E5|nr:small integral membrane protein 12 [Aphidius gifuensis]